MNARRLVSRMKSTANWRAFVSRAIQHFLPQRFPGKELVILDDGENGVANLILSNVVAPPRLTDDTDDCIVGVLKGKGAKNVNIVSVVAS